jgi:Lrp/AsnC family leucine-responsive transcriptional regulator
MSTNNRARPPDGVRNDGDLLDAVNRRILAILTDDTRISTAELARQVGMSAPAVRDRDDVQTAWKNAGPPVG